MPSALCLFWPCCPCPGRWPRGFGGRRPRRLLLRPPPPEGLPGPAFIVLSKFLLPDFDSYQLLPDSNYAWVNLVPSSATVQRAVAASCLRMGVLTPCGRTTAGRTSGYDLPLSKTTLLLVQTKPINLRIDFPISDLSRRLEKGWRGRPARERGQMRTPLSYSPQPCRARAIAVDFCTGGHGCWTWLPASATRLRKRFLTEFFAPGGILRSAEASRISQGL
jgi:hypothetical protein